MSYTVKQFQNLKKKKKQQQQASNNKNETKLPLKTEEIFA